jgi:hypothetical protein
MRTLTALLGLLLGAGLVPALVSVPAQAAEPAAAGTNYYIQLVRGTDDPIPPEKGAIKVGAKLDRQLQPVFRWKHYWEVQRASTSVAEGRMSRVNLNSGHSLEIDLSQPGKRSVRLFRDKKLVRSMVCSRGQEFMIQGSDLGNGKIWFIVVRTDPPST